MTTELLDALHEIFLPLMSKERKRKDRDQRRFVHYTSAEAAIGIIERAEVWLRNSLLMNDFSEVQHGESCWKFAWEQDRAGGKIRECMDRLKPGLAGEFETVMASTFDARFGGTYLLSCSEHKETENEIGRLSMWRAYGGNTNVALVIHGAPLTNERANIPVYSSKVFYADQVDFAAQMAGIADSMEARSALLTTIGPAEVLRMMSLALHFSVLSTKHPGFHEEEEWRVLYSPTMWPAPGETVLEEIKILGGVPQKIYKFRLQNAPEYGLTGISPAELIERIIIGPTPYPLPIYNALVSVLQKANVPNAEERVLVSGVPLRRS